MIDKAFFQSFEARTKDYAARAGFDVELQVELVLVTGRVFAVDTIVEAADAWLQVDGHDVSTEEQKLSLVLPYHQISHVLMTRHRPRAGRAGIRPIR